MMKVLHLLIVLYLVSNITSAFQEFVIVMGVAGVVGLGIGSLFAWISEFRNPLLPFHSNRLKADLRNSLFGQHIVSDVVLKAVSSFMTDKNPNKLLVLSFHGTTGTGKNHVAKIIARNIYKGKIASMFTHIYLTIIFQTNELHMSTVNAGGNVITEVALDFWRSGRERKEIRLTSKELETKISEHINKNENGGFSHSSLIDHHLIDHYVPFLPLELKHVYQCVIAEMIHMNIMPIYEVAGEVARDMPYYPEKERIFAVKGCKSVRQKLVLYID